MNTGTMETGDRVRRAARRHASLAACAVSLFYALGAWAQPAPGGGPPGPGSGPDPGAAPQRESIVKPLAADAPQPSSDPRDLDGAWVHDSMLVFQNSTDMFGKKTPFNDAGLKVMRRRLNSYKIGTPYINASARCIPPGVPWQMDLNFPFRIFQSKDRFDVLFQEYHGSWTISMNPAKAPPAGYMGRSIGRWVGDTLVVETTGLKDGLWLDVNGTPISRNARLEQRIRKVHTDHWYLEIVSTLDDPTYYKRPWSWVRDYSWRPDMAVTAEYNCELQTGKPDGLDTSLVPEPQD